MLKLCQGLQAFLHRKFIQEQQTVAHVRTVSHSSGLEIVMVTCSRIIGEFLAMIGAV